MCSKHTVLSAYRDTTHFRGFRKCTRLLIKMARNYRGLFGECHGSAELPCCRCHLIIFAAVGQLTAVGKVNSLPLLKVNSLLFRSTHCRCTGQLTPAATQISAPATKMSAAVN